MLNCPDLACSKGEYFKGCICISNKKNCGTFNEETLSCEMCSDSAFYALKDDLENGSHCVMRSILVIVLVPAIPALLIILLLITCRKCLLTRCFCCEIEKSCCHKCWKSVCVFIEKVLKILFCVNCTEGGILCCKFCFDRLIAIEPYEKKNPVINIQ